MIDTNHVKNERFNFYRIGNPKSDDVILIVGSCRMFFYLNYLNEYNKNGKYLIYFIDPIDYLWDKNNALRPSHDAYTAFVDTMEKRSDLLDIIKKTKIYIHECYKYHGIFNGRDMSRKNIFDFGMKPNVNVCIPAFDNVFMLFSEYIEYSIDYKLQAKEDYANNGKLSQDLIKKILNRSGEHIERFYKNIADSSLPEFRQYYDDNFRKKRMFYTFNHVTNEYTIPIFRMINDKYLKFNIPDSMWTDFKNMRMFDNVKTPYTEYDVEYYGIQWNEPMVNFKEYNKL